MARIKITNGFPNVGGKGNLLSGILLKGVINIGDLLIVNNDIKIPIIELKDLSTLVPQMVTVTVPREYDNAVNWSLLYGQEFEIDNLK